MTGDVEFFNEIFDFYRANKRKLKKVLRIKSDDEIVDFCADFNQMTSWREQRFIKHEYVCKLALILANALGKRLPDHLHARMVLGLSSGVCVEYVKYIQNLKPNKFFGLINPNKNRFKMYSLSVNGMLLKKVSK